MCLSAESLLKPVPGLEEVSRRELGCVKLWIQEMKHWFGRQSVFTLRVVMILLCFKVFTGSTNHNVRGCYGIIVAGENYGTLADVPRSSLLFDLP